MNVMRFNDALDAPALMAGTAPVPEPGPGEILVRVFAAGVTPTELLWYPITHTRDGARRSSAIPGHEFSGIIEAVGSEIDPNQIGREIYGMNDWFAEGASAEYCISAPGLGSGKAFRVESC
jgi:NADPH:quinone reductase-like Zn-dependent oxidoreductase